MTATHTPTPIAFSGSIPMYYEKYLGPLFFEPFALEMAKRIRTFYPASILELAGGTGRLTKYLPFASRPLAQVVASDLNPAMLQVAQDRLGSLPIDWAIVDAQTLPFEDASFDCVAVQFGVMFYADKVQAFKEAYRVLKPGGQLIFSAWDALAHNPVAASADQITREFFPVDPPKFYEVPFAYSEEEKIREDLAEADFFHVKMEVLSLKGHADSAEDIALGALEGTPLCTAVIERDKNSLPLMRKKMTEQMLALFGNGPITVPIQARIVTAIKE